MMDKFASTCEIVEEGELNFKQRSKGGNYRQNSEIGISNRERRSPGLKLKRKESLEDDLNQLFQTISIRTSTKSLDLGHQPGTSPFRKEALKKPITMGTPRSPGFVNTEPATLKQALRDLCLSKASENAATKRLSKSTASSGVLEAGRVKNLYNSVLIEASKPGPSSNGMLQTSLVPEESKSVGYGKISPHFQMPKTKLMSQSTPSSPQLNAAGKQYGTVTSMVQSEALLRKVMKKASNLESQPKEKQMSAPSSSCSKTDVSVVEGEGSLNKFNLVQEVDISLSSEKIYHLVHDTMLMSSNQKACSSRFGKALAQDSAGPSNMQDRSFTALEGVGSNHSTDSFRKLDVARMQNDIASAAKRNASNRNVHSSRFGIATKFNTASFSTVASKEVETRTLKMDLAAKEKHTASPSTSSAGSGNSFTKQVGSGPSSTKPQSEASQPNLARKVRLQSTLSKRVPKSRVIKVPKDTTRSVKPVVKTKTVVKKKLKRRSTSSLYAAKKEGNAKSSLEPTSQLVCQRCRCALEKVCKGTAQVSPVSPCSGPGKEVSSTILNPGPSESGSTPKSYNTVVEAKEKKSNGKGEFSQSSGSLGEYCSTSTSISDDSNASGSAFGNKPHMSKDVRWEAINNIRKQHTILDLRHFNLSKKLGSGDIGTVYLAELIGTNCLFAIKVMDNEFLERRRKMPRAQTEREILRMLDHPFLPTLYAQFTSDNLSCLVMEYCPGGDLHVLRQRQPTRCFSEPAARFYVAEVLLALEYLHMLGIIYRDLKPENILVREDGHIMLTDFDLSLRCNVSPTLLKSSQSNIDPARISGPCTGSSCIGPFCIEPSCQVSCFSPRFLPAAAKTRKAKAELAKHVRSLPQLVAEPTDARSNSFVGTHEYLAPEIIKGEGHGAAVDWWTFGVFLYELLYGKTPFKGPGNDETLAKVVLQGLKFPDTPFVSLQARDLIRGLLVKDPENRLGSAKGAAEIKQHPFFEGLNWALIRCAVPPELPECTDYESPYTAPSYMTSKLPECKATGDHLEFELF